MQPQPSPTYDELVDSLRGAHACIEAAAASQRIPGSIRFNLRTEGNRAAAVLDRVEAQRADASSGAV